jgi:hypothetical protein
MFNGDQGIEINLDQTVTKEAHDSFLRMIYHINDISGNLAVFRGYGINNADEFITRADSGQLFQGIRLPLENGRKNGTGQVSQPEIMTELENPNGSFSLKNVAIRVLHRSQTDVVISADEQKKAIWFDEGLDNYVDFVKIDGIQYIQLTIAAPANAAYDSPYNRYTIDKVGSIDPEGDNLKALDQAIAYFSYYFSAATSYWYIPQIKFLSCGDFAFPGNESSWPDFFEKLAEEHPLFVLKK